MQTDNIRSAARSYLDSKQLLMQEFPGVPESTIDKLAGVIMASSGQITQMGKEVIRSRTLVAQERATQAKAKKSPHRNWSWSMIHRPMMSRVIRAMDGQKSFTVKDIASLMGENNVRGVMACFVMLQSLKVIRRSKDGAWVPVRVNFNRAIRELG